MTTHSQSSSPRSIALVTGAGSGIGREIAILLSHHQHDLALLGRTPASLQHTARALNPAARALILPCDLASPPQIAAAARQALDHFSRIDVLVNNAADAPMLSIDKTTPDILQHTFAVNAIAPALLIHHLWPAMTAARSGCIINISTLATRDPFPGFFAYAASKASVNLLARSCNDEGKLFNIRAFSIAPGAVETRMLRSIVPESALPRSHALDPAAVARLALDCIQHRCDSRAGQTIFITADQGVF